MTTKEGEHPDLDREFYQIQEDKTRAGTIVIDGQSFRNPEKSAKVAADIKAKLVSSQLPLPESPRVYGRGGQQIDVKTGEVLTPGLSGLRASPAERAVLLEKIRKLRDQGNL